METKYREESRADFGNWIRLRIIVGFVLGALLLMMVATLFESLAFRSVFFSGALFSVGMATFLSYLYYQFADSGGAMQRKLWELTVDHLQWKGRGHALDVGTGNGSLAILLAERYPTAQVTGVDLWGRGWEYSREDCERNARRCAVDDRADFLPGSAAQLPFEDESFDAVVSHFVFHEVKELEDKFHALREALRVLRPGGAFSFHDMFLEPNIYSSVQSLLKRMDELGMREVELIETGPILDLPFLLRSRRVLGRSAILRGIK